MFDPIKAFAVIGIMMFAWTRQSSAAPATRPAQPYRVAEALHGPDSITPGLPLWRIEMDGAGDVTADAGGRLDINVPRGVTVWFEPPLEAPVRIAYDVTAIAAGGPNDHVSDVNCFWMASDARGDDFFAVERRGTFAEYHPLRCYYVGLGGNRNTTTRFRRYIGDARVRPLLPEHDRGDAGALLAANVKMRIELIAFDGLVQYWRDGKMIFEMHDPAFYPRGRFGLRTVDNHMRVENFTVNRLEPAADRQ